MDDLNQQDDQNTAFPAVESVPGQSVSRSAYALFRDGFLATAPWADAYLVLRSQGWDWRKAAWIAWASMPTEKRKPETQAGLANLLGLKSARTIRQWRTKNPEMDAARERFAVAVLGDALADVVDAWVTVAKMPDPKAHPDRIKYLETMGVYKPKSALELTGKDGEALLPVTELIAALRQADEILDDDIDDDLTDGDSE